MQIQLGAGVHVVSESPLTLGVDLSPHMWLLLSPGDVRYERLVNATDDDVRHLLLDWALPLVLMLRCTPALHAAAILPDGIAGATLLCGLSGAGKSTTSFVMGRRGHHKLADDISAISLGETGFFVEPGLSHSKLMGDTLERFDVSRHGLRPVLHKADKYLVPPGAVAPTRQPVREIIELVASGESQLALRELKGVEKLGVLDRHTAGTTVIGQVGLRKMHMDWLMRLSASVPVYRLARPAGRDTTTEIAQLLERHWSMTSARQEGD